MPLNDFFTTQQDKSAAKDTKKTPTSTRPVFFEKYFNFSNSIALLSLILLGFYVVKSAISMLNLFSLAFISFKILTQGHKKTNSYLRKLSLLLTATAIFLGFIISQQSLLFFALCLPLASFIIYDLVSPLISNWPIKNKDQSVKEYLLNCFSHLCKPSPDHWTFLMLSLPFLYPVMLVGSKTLAGMSLFSNSGLSFFVSVLSPSYVPLLLSALSFCFAFGYICSQKDYIYSEYSKYSDRYNILNIAWNAMTSDETKSPGQTTSRMEPSSSTSHSPGKNPCCQA